MHKLKGHVYTEAKINGAFKGRAIRNFWELGQKNNTTAVPGKQRVLGLCKHPFGNDTKNYIDKHTKNKIVFFAHLIIGFSSKNTALLCKALYISIPLAKPNV